MREGLRKHLVTIVVAFTTASVAGGGTAFAIVANANKVDGYDANQLSRMARSSTNLNALVGSSGAIRSVHITAPRNGFLFMVASSDVFNYVSFDNPSCFLRLDGVELSSSRRTIELDATTNAEENCATDAAWPVAHGTHTVTFEAVAVGTDTTFDEATLEVLFVPFNGQGVAPKPADPHRVAGPAGNN